MANNIIQKQTANKQCIFLTFLSNKIDLEILNKNLIIIINNIFNRFCLVHFRPIDLITVLFDF
jgi:hypothetical protein